jgi:hypothetical protein
MKSRLVVVVCLLVVMSHVAAAQTLRAFRATATEEPPFLPAVTTASQSDEVIARLLEFPPAIPLGPVDVLKAYEDGMSLIAQRLSAELSTISQANRANQITRDQADYLIQDRYQVAMMQREVLSALHDSLQHDLTQAGQQSSSVGQSENSIVVQELPLAGNGQTQ